METDLLHLDFPRDLEKQMQEWRRKLHAMPELSLEENRTAAFIAQLLREFGLEVHEGIGGTGVVGVLKNGTSKRSIALRADMDALPILEESELDYRSVFEGKMHACGHDGHCAMLLGAAKALAESKEFNGTVVFLFQPAEEIGKGALAMLEDGLLQRFPIDEVYGLHNMPSIPEGTVSVCEGSIMASEDAFTIEVIGKRAHAAFPHLGIDPIVIGAQIILGLQSIVSRKLDPLESAVVSVTEINTDGAVNVIPNSLRLNGCVRTLSQEVQELVETEIERIAKGTCAAHGAECRVVYEHHFINTHNAPEQTRIVAEAAKLVVGEARVDTACTPVMASEDFGYLLRERPGCYFFLGTAIAGKQNYGLHHQKYDFNDRMLLTGTKLWKAIVSTRLAK